MTGSSSSLAILRQLPSPTAPISAPPPPIYSLPLGETVLLGRDPRCHIVLDSRSYSGVSRQHAQLSPSQTATTGWQICDLTSANGTYVNGNRIYNCQDLHWGDRITLAQEGPEFVFEQPGVAGAAPLPAPYAPIGAAPRSGQPAPPDAVTLSQLFPIVSTGRDLTGKAYLVPGIITVIFVVSMFFILQNPDWFDFFAFLLALYISGLAFFFVYQLCGKRKPWLLLAGSAGLTALLLVSPVLLVFIIVFRGILPGSIDGLETLSFPEVLIRMFFGAGLMEELLKAIPIFLAMYVGSLLRPPLRDKLGVWEPLDGILIGTASAVGFTLLETLAQYVPEIINNVTLQGGEGLGRLVGIQLLIPRILGSIAGHMAYSGYFGYFIGLSTLKPSKRWRILGIGYLTSSSLHALWNAIGSVANPFVAAFGLTLVGATSYAFLVAAILKARALSPTRSENFATRIVR